MNFEINKLIESDIDQVREIGWILYHVDIEKGLSSEATLKVIETLAKIDNDGLHIYTEADLEKARDEGYGDGLSEAQDIYDVDCDCCS